MSVAEPKPESSKFSFSSSVKADVWHPKTSPKAYEQWYFDALSDDGSEAVVIIFLDNFIFSPRYNSRRIIDSNLRFPAISFTYYRNGRPLYRAVNEFPADSFTASQHLPECRIGDCEFHFESAPYGDGYVISLKAILSRNRILEANFEWLSIESDFASDDFCYQENAHCWNMVAPRSDVTGSLTVFDKRGAAVDTRQFRGTGYHDHNLDNRWLPTTVENWHWGRAHFADCTAVFYRYREMGDENPATRFFLIQDGRLHERDVAYEEQNYHRDKFGLRYPARLRLVSEDNMRLRVKPLAVIDSSFYYLRFLSEMTLTLRDGKPRKTKGITEFLAPRRLRNRWLHWLNDLRIGKSGKGPLF